MGGGALFAIGLIACGSVPESATLPQTNTSLAAAHAQSPGLCDEFDQYQCFALEQAFTLLSLSSDSICVLAGAWASGAEFKFEDEYGWYGRVDAISGSTIWLTPLAFSGGELMNTLAHEGAHIGGKYHPEATEIGARCAGEW